MLDWLEGRLGNVVGERVLVHGFGFACLGVVERGNEEKGGDYILRYYLNDGIQYESSRRGPPGVDEIAFSRACGEIISDLILANMIRWREPPPEHDGIAVYVEIPLRQLAS